MELNKRCGSVAGSSARTVAGSCFPFRFQTMPDRQKAEHDFVEFEGGLVDTEAGDAA